MCDLLSACVTDPHPTSPFSARKLAGRGANAPPTGHSPIISSAMNQDKFRKSRHLDLYIDPVEQRPGYPLLVLLDLDVVARALPENTSEVYSLIHAKSL